LTKICFQEGSVFEIEVYKFDSSTMSMFCHDHARWGDGANLCHQCATRQSLISYILKENHRFHGTVHV